MFLVLRVRRVLCNRGDSMSLALAQISVIGGGGGVRRDDECHITRAYMNLQQAKLLIPFICSSYAFYEPSGIGIGESCMREIRPYCMRALDTA